MDAMAITFCRGNISLKQHMAELGNKDFNPKWNAVH